MNNTTSEFKIGNIVKVKDDLIPDVLYGTDKFVYPMNKHRGSVAEIVGYTDKGYMLDIDNVYQYTDEMIEMYVDEVAKSDYKHNEEVESIIGHIQKVILMEKIDKALDNNSKEEFEQLMKEYQKLN